MSIRFCSPKVMEIIARERNMEIDEVTKSGGKSKMIVGKKFEYGETRDENL